MSPLRERIIEWSFTLACVGPLLLLMSLQLELPASVKSALAWVLGSLGALGAAVAIIASLTAGRGDQD